METKVITEGTVCPNCGHDWESREHLEFSHRTPGPWYVTASAAEGTVFGGPNHRLIVPHADSSLNEPEDWGNRRLIAAAPALLAAAEKLANCYHSGFQRDEMDSLIVEFDAAIAVARGK